MDDLVLVLEDVFGAVGKDHIVNTLVGYTHHLRVLVDDVEVFLEGAFPVYFAVIGEVR